MDRGRTKAAAWGLTVTFILAGLIVLGSRNLANFDAALAGYTFATLFATFGVTYRFTMWLQRPPTALYWKRGWQFLFRWENAARVPGQFLKRFAIDFMLNRFIWRRGLARGAAHWLIMWGCLLAMAIVLPLVFGWVHFQSLNDPARTPADNLLWYRPYLFDLPGLPFPIHSALGSLVFHALVWPSLLVVAGVLLALHRRLRDQGAAALQQFGEDVLPLLMLLAISVTGLLLTASYTWMKGYAFEFLQMLHAATVIFTLLWLPFGKFFHIFVRPVHLAVGAYRDVGRQGEQACCRRCGEAFASLMHVEDLIAVERQLGYRYEMAGSAAQHYQWICPRCRRALLGLAQAALCLPSAGRPSPGTVTDDALVNGSSRDASLPMGEVRVPLARHALSGAP